MHLGGGDPSYLIPIAFRDNSSFGISYIPEHIDGVTYPADAWCVNVLSAQNIKIVGTNWNARVIAVGY